MKTALVPVREVRGPDLVEDVLTALNDAWRLGIPTFDDFAQLAALAQSSPSLTARLIKTDLNHRHTHGLISSLCRLRC